MKNLVVFVTLAAVSFSDCMSVVELYPRKCPPYPGKHCNCCDPDYSHPQYSTCSKYCGCLGAILCAAPPYPKPKPEPCACPEYYAPVCCKLPNGKKKTYDNICFAKCEVGKAKADRCPKGKCGQITDPCDGISNPIDYCCKLGKQSKCCDTIKCPVPPPDPCDGISNPVDYCCKYGKQSKCCDKIRCPVPRPDPCSRNWWKCCTGGRKNGLSQGCCPDTMCVTPGRHCLWCKA